MDVEPIFENEILKSVLDQLDTNIYITDAVTDEIVYMNRSMKEHFQEEQPEGKTCWEVVQKGMSGRCNFCRIQKLKEAEGEKVFIWEHKNTRNGRTYKHFDSLFTFHGKEYHLQNSTDVTDYMALSETATMDDLTGILNRRAGKEWMEKIRLRAEAEKKTFCVVLYDVNQLKLINDRYGHEEGDHLLRYISFIAKNALQEGDFIFRLSGDEFVIVFYGESLIKAKDRVKEILERLEKEKQQDSIFYDVSFSYGIVELLPGEVHTVPEILSKADKQMYVQKRSYHIRQTKKQLAQTAAEQARIDQFEYDKEHLYDALIHGTDDYIFVGNLKNGTFRYPPAMVEEFGLPGQVVKNAAVFWGDLLHPDDERYFLESNQEIADGRQIYHNIEYRAKNVRGEWIWLRCRGKMIRDEEGKPGLFAGMITNLGKRNKIDHMTGLYNRFEFEGIVKKYLAEDKKFGILILDMDSFQNINDLYNRSFGDEILRLTGQKIASFLPSNAQIYRMDGDEFGVVVRNGTREECMRIFKHIQHAFQKQQEYGGRKYYSTLSAGCALYPQHGGKYLDLLKCANYSLETSKKHGKNRLTIFSPGIIGEKERSLEVVELLRESIECGFRGFSVCYQPQVEADTGELYGAEALARWSCGKYGEISPEEFIPLLEENGMIMEVGAWIFHQAAVQCREWNKKKQNFHISVNLSYRQLQETNLVFNLNRRLQEYGLDPSNLTLELTETYLVKGELSVLETIGGIQQTGAQIAMDDFGIGYSSLYSLKSIPVDVVKIDRSFVKGITEEAFNATLIRSITELCHTVGKKVCLEGIETAEEYQAVKNLGLDWIQGFYFGRPVRPNEFTKRYFA